MLQDLSDALKTWDTDKKSEKLSGAAQESDILLAIENNIIHKNLKRVSPMSIPLLLEFNIEKVKEDNLIDIIEEENNLLLEANLH